MNKTEMSKPNKLFDDHTRSFNLVRGGLEKYYSNYVNKKKIIALLEFWFFSAITIYEIYGK